MKALGVLGNESYKVAFMLDFKSMVTVHTQKRGVHPIAESVAYCGKNTVFANAIISDRSGGSRPCKVSWL
jgi:hypothetical protein